MAGAAADEPRTEEPRVERPVVLTVDDDPEVLRAVERDLRRRYARDYRIVRADSGASALDVVRELKLRSTPVALLVADQRMPGMTGVEFLDQAKRVVPDARTVLLTAYADTEAAIEAINSVHLDHYILKPWDPPEERLYPVLDDLLEEWQATTRRDLDGLRVVGHRWSADAHRLRDFLARNQVPFRWLEADTAPAAAPILEAAGDVGLPLVVLEDGRMLSAPTPVEVADAIGLHTRSDTEFFDLVIVGGGPAGLAAAVYGASEGLSTAMIEASAPGGQAGMSSRIENYLGFPQGVAGGELARRALAQARRFGAEVISPRTVARLARRDPYRIVVLDDGSEISCSALVIAVGVAYRTLDAPGVEELTGAGVYYGAAATEARSMEGEHVVVVGGANSAGQAAVHFARYAESVTILVRGESIEETMSSYLVAQLAALPNVTVRVRTEVETVGGDGHLEAVTVVDRAKGESEVLKAAGLFAFIGAAPRTEWLGSLVARDDLGFVVTGPDLRAASLWSLERDPYLLETSLPGAFAVGDVRARSVKRVASAVGEGSIAVQFVHQYLAV